MRTLPAVVLPLLFLAVHCATPTMPESGEDGAKGAAGASPSITITTGADASTATTTTTNVHDAGVTTDGGASDGGDGDCAAAKDLGSVDGDDDDSAALTATGTGPQWLKVEVRDVRFNVFGGTMGALFKGTTGGSAATFVVTDACGGKVLGTSSPTGEASVSWDDDDFTDESATVFVRILSTGAWSLQVTGGND